jgi:lysophospholipase L1-like esterase
MFRPHRRLVAALAPLLLFAGLAVGAPAAAAAFTPGAPVPGASPPGARTPGHAKAPGGALPAMTVRQVPAGDEIIDGRGDSAGWHLYAASSGGNWAWQPLATLAPAGLDGNGQRWTGRQCITGDGRHVVAVVAPWSASNTPAGMDRGGIAYSIDARTGAVRPLLSGVSLYYFTPSCGPGSTVALTRFVGNDERTTQLVLADAASAQVRAVLTLPGQYTSAAPAPGGGFFAVSGSAIVQLSGHRRIVRARPAGQPFDLVANAAGGVDYLLGTGPASASVWHLDARGPHQAGTGAFGALALFEGRGGHTVAAGTTALDPAAGMAALPGTSQQVEAASLDGTAFSPAPVQSPGRAGPAHGATSSAAAGGALPRVPLLLATEQGTRSWTPSAAASASAAFPPVLRDDGSIAGLPAAGTRPRAAARSGSGASAATAQFTSTCAVPRNDVYLQAMQPSPQDVDWAANLAGRGLLAGSAARPSGYANLSLPAYSPSSDFPLPAPFGPGGASIPREVLEGIIAQESNFNQATWHSVQGVSGNPLIGDYYGAAGGYLAGVTTPDCGYGLGQVTTGMHTGEMPYDLQRKVAVDYAENVAAAAQLLAQKWNQLVAAGITANTANPSVLEDWYLAIWAYNSGLHANAGSGPWGLGWANNPANPDYPYNRHPFLHEDLASGTMITYADAATPGNWPYQEKVMGWMEVPIESPLTGLASYQGTIETTDPTGSVNVLSANAYELTRPATTAFCDLADNQCDPAVCSRSTYGGNCGPGTSDGTGPCTRSDYECWWHVPVSWCTQASPCHSGSWEYNSGDSEPPAQSSAYYPQPACSVDTAVIPPGSDIVDSQPIAVNLQGCDSGNENWASSGSFAFSYGDSAVPTSQQTDMDVHQLGTGLGGHLWFTHTNEPTDANGVSLWGVTGTWTPSLQSLGNYIIKVFIPSEGATSTQANYSIDPGYGSSSIVAINQNSYANQWISLGTYWLGEHANVSLTNLGTTASGDLAFSGVAFVPAANPAPYAILGDSYSSGEGTNNYDADTNTPSNSCHRSPDAFGRVYAAGSSAFGGGNVEHLACSGATTDNILTTGSVNEPPQISELMPSTRLVTVTIGGNDVGFAGVLARCVTPLLTCEDYYTQNDSNNLDAAIENLHGKLIATYTAIKQKAPAATVIAVTYPNIFSPGSAGQSGKTCSSIGAIGSSDVEWLIRETFHLDDVIEAAAQDAGIQILDERYAFLGHELCTGAPWVNSLLSQPITDISGAFHPNTAGYAAIAADLTGAPTVPAIATALAAHPHARTAVPAVATWGGWRNAAMTARMPSTARALGMFKQLTVANPSNTSYSDTYFGDWSTAPPSARGCNRRTYVLTRDADPGTISYVPGSTCTIASATWQSPYNAPGGPLATITGNPMASGSPGSPVDVDHVVSKKDAWVSGADLWIGTATNPNEERNDFANDAAGLELLTVSAVANGQKLDKTPDQWLPDNTDPPGNPAFTCDFLKMYVEVKWQYHLTITLGEFNTINSRLTVAACP